MGFLRYANAAVVKPVVSLDAWGHLLQGSVGHKETGQKFANTLRIEEYDPNKYMLTHCTIIASVDTENSPAPLGQHLENGFQVNRKYSDWLITPNTSKYLNNNFDAWERKLLLSAYKTFIGGENYCFVPGTEIVMADGTHKRIDEVSIGDVVLTHKGRGRKVLRTFLHAIDEDIVALQFDSLPNTYKCTVNHPFLSDTWVPADALCVGATVFGAGTAVAHTVQTKAKEQYTGLVHNIEVEEDNSYVLANGVATHNCEHIQVPELSKGKIIDAAARDIGDSVYIDILVATEKKHRALIAAIQQNRLTTLSMGCFLPETPVTIADGRRIPIKDIQPGEMVLTHKGRAREVLNQQIHVGIWDMRRISIVGLANTVSATDNHPFYVLRPAKVCACGCGEPLGPLSKFPVRRIYRRFKIGHDKRILNPNNTYSLEEARARRTQLNNIQALHIEEVRADELCVGDYVVFPKFVSASNYDPGIAKARLLGYLRLEGLRLET